MCPKSPLSKQDNEERFSRKVRSRYLRARVYVCDTL